MDGATFIGTLISNIIGYDGIIVVVTFCNFLNYDRISKLIADVESETKLYMDKFLISSNLHNASLSIEKVEIGKISEKCININKRHSFFTNIIEILPYLGILGTVVALISLVGENHSDATMQNFFAALTSTFWGVACSIILKLFNAKITPKIEKLNEDISREKNKQVAGSIPSAEAENEKKGD